MLYCGDQTVQFIFAAQQSKLPTILLGRNNNNFIKLVLEFIPLLAFISLQTTKQNSKEHQKITRSVMLYDLILLKVYLFGNSNPLK